MMRYFRFFIIIVFFLHCYHAVCVCFVRNINRCSLRNEKCSREGKRETNEKNNNKRIRPNTKIWTRASQSKQKSRVPAVISSRVTRDFRLQRYLRLERVLYIIIIIICFSRTNVQTDIIVCNILCVCIGR